MVRSAELERKRVLAVLFVGSAQRCSDLAILNGSCNPGALPRGTLFGQGCKGPPRQSLEVGLLALQCHEAAMAWPQRRPV